MNNDQLKSRIINTAKESNITIQAVWDKYLFDRFLAKLSFNKYKDEFVLKGGYLLENVVGIEQRTTLDLDFSYRLSDISIEVLTGKIQSIIETPTNDNVLLSIKDIIPIAEKEKYDGYRVRINATIGNIKKTFSIDIATGDTITPKPNSLNYHTTSADEIIQIKSYNLETMLAEKFQTVIEKSTFNTRMKDYYDIFVLINHPNLDIDLCHNALVNTFETRKTSIKKNDIEAGLETLKKSKLIKDMYDDYIRKNTFAKKTSFSIIIEAFYKVKNLIKYQPEFELKFKSLLFVRHGEDEQDKTGGWSSNSLTNHGVEQIISLKSTIKDKIIITENKVVISSDLKRAKQTTEILFDSSEKVIFDERLRECNNGYLANLTKEDFQKSFPFMYFDSLKYNEHYPNGESPKENYHRVQNFFEEINQKYANKDLVIVAHAGTFGILKSLLDGIVWSNKQKYKIGYADFFEFIR
jgi:broad specificity phosphatase PhoE